MSSGEAIITGVYAGIGGDVTATMTVTVYSPIELTADSVTVEVGKTVNVPITADSLDGVMFIGADDRIFTVSENGVIKGVKEGEAKLFIRTKNQTLTVSVKVVAASGGCGGALNSGSEFAVFGAAVALGVIALLRKKKDNV